MQKDVARDWRNKMAGTGYYLYGVIKDIFLKDSIPGIGREGNVFAVSFNGIAGVISRVKLDEFGEASLKQNLESLDWVREKAFSHEKVMEDVMKMTTIIPMKFCTIFTATDRVLELLEKRYEFFADLLQRYSGRNEWGVKVYCSKKPELSAEKARSGREYLMKKKAEKDMELQNEAMVNVSVEKIFQKIKDMAEASIINRPTPRELLPYKDKEQVLNASFLVKETDADKLASLVNELAEEHKGGMVMELVGPLPVYTFISNSSGEI